MKLFAVTNNGRKGECFDNAPLMELGAPSAYTLPHYPDYTVHLRATIYDCDDVQPEEFGEDAIIFCTGKDGDRWKWHMLVGDAGVKRGLSEGWLHHPDIPQTMVVHDITPVLTADKPSWWQSFLSLFR